MNTSDGAEVVLQVTMKGGRARNCTVEDMAKHGERILLRRNKATSAFSDAPILYH